MYKNGVTERGEPRERAGSDSKKHEEDKEQCDNCGSYF